MMLFAMFRFCFIPTIVACISTLLYLFTEWVSNAPGPVSVLVLFPAVFILSIVLNFFGLGRF